MASLSHISTAAQLLNAGDIGFCELVRGELSMMSPAGFEHGDIESCILERMRRYTRQHRLGKVVGGDTGFVIERDPDTVRSPDVAFVKRERLAGQRVRGFFPGAPDLAVEVVSPQDSLAEVRRKAAMWLACGTEEVWIVDPDARTVEVHVSQGPVETRAAGEVLSPALLPGFALPVNEIFTSDD